MRYPAGFISAFYNPLQNPNAPTIGTASAISSGISVAFTAPSNVGGSAITSYIATAKRTSDGVLFTASGASSPITITGLTQVAFTATVVAVNSYGPSASSAASNSVTPLPTVGDAYQGGFFAGQISTAGNSIADYNLVIGPLSSTQSALAYKLIPSSDPGATSAIDGPANSASMNSATNPAAQFCEGLSVGGFSDWYMPAKNELEVCYYNLKPSTQNNFTSSGINANAVPARASNYVLTGPPTQTAATDFQDSNSEAFGSAIGPTANYWSSTENNANNAAMQRFNSGYQESANKATDHRVRAVRRVAV
jgi:hypothetical protein